MVSLQPRVYAQYVGPRCSELAKVSYLCVERKAGYPMGTENPAFLLAPEVTFQAIVQGLTFWSIVNYGQDKTRQEDRPTDLVATV